jgi:hypothetical protein
VSCRIISHAKSTLNRFRKMVEFGQGKVLLSKIKGEIVGRTTILMAALTE